MATPLATPPSEEARLPAVPVRIAAPEACSTASVRVCPEAASRPVTMSVARPAMSAAPPAAMLTTSQVVRVQRPRQFRAPGTSRSPPAAGSPARQ
ncbi:hypothetical protein [Roseivivax sp. CAU 1761]